MFLYHEKKTTRFIVLHVFNMHAHASLSLSLRYSLVVEYTHTHIRVTHVLHTHTHTHLGFPRQVCVCGTLAGPFGPHGDRFPLTRVRHGERCPTMVFILHTHIDPRWRVLPCAHKSVSTDDEMGYRMRAVQRRREREGCAHMERFGTHWCGRASSQEDFIDNDQNVAGH